MGDEYMSAIFASKQDECPGVPNLLKLRASDPHSRTLTLGCCAAASTLHAIGLSPRSRDHHLRLTGLAGRVVNVARSNGRYDTDHSVKFSGTNWKVPSTSLVIRSVSLQSVVFAFSDVLETEQSTCAWAVRRWHGQYMSEMTSSRSVLLVGRS